MKSIDEHRQILREIADTAFTTGINSLTEDQKLRYPNLSKNEFSAFIAKCHEGYKIAQKMLINEIMEYQGLLPKLKSDLKETRRKRDKITEEQLTANIQVINHRIRSFTHIADSIAWTMIGGEIHIARRFHIGENEIKQLSASNLKHAIETADEINKSLNHFALLSDLTSFIQLGDLLVKGEAGNFVIELKEGIVNSNISDFLNNLKTNNEVFDEQKLSGFDKGTVKQIKRVIRQQERMNRASNVIRHDKGLTPDGRQIRVYTPQIHTEKYLRELHEMHLQLDEKTWSYNVIDNCLLIGMYRDESLDKGGPFIIEAMLKEKAKNYTIIDWQSITDNLSEPIFNKPLSPDFVIDVLTGRIKVIMGLDYDSLIDCFNNVGLKTRWLTVIETKRHKTIDNAIFTVNDMAIEILTPNGESQLIGAGIITKILYDSIKPSNLAKQFLNLNDQDFHGDDPEESAT